MGKEDPFAEDSLNTVDDVVSRVKFCGHIDKLKDIGMDPPKKESDSMFDACIFRGRSRRHWTC